MENDKAKSIVEEAVDQGRKVAEKAGQTVKDSYKVAQEYVGDFDLTDFVQRDPWLAIAAAFALGYIAAAAFRRAS